MLLLKKKKYAAVKVQFKDGTAYEVFFYGFIILIAVLLNKSQGNNFLLQVIERKGLDMVRRDWSLLSKELGDSCLAEILSGKYVLPLLFSFIFFLQIVFLTCT